MNIDFILVHCKSPTHLFVSDAGKSPRIDARNVFAKLPLTLFCCGVSVDECMRSTAGGRSLGDTRRCCNDVDMLATDDDGAVAGANME